MALKTLEKLVADHPDVIEFRHRLGLGHNILGNLLWRSDRRSEAEAEFRASLTTYRKLADANPRIAEYRDGEVNAANNLSVAVRRLGRPHEALALCERAVALRETLARENPGVPDYRAGLAENLLNRGLARLAERDAAGAAADLRRAAGQYAAESAPDGENRFLFGCVRAAPSGLADHPGSGVSAAEGLGEADAAMAELRRAVAGGYRNPDAYRTTDALDPLRRREDFRVLMMDLSLPADAFARGE